jgi:hypothetical protein
MTGIARAAVIAVAYTAAFAIGSFFWCKGAALKVKDLVT